MVIPIAETIRNLDNNRDPLEDYMGFGWDDLERTYKFRNRLSETKKSAYRERINHIKNTSNFNCDEN